MKTLRVDDATGDILTLGHGRRPEDPANVITATTDLEIRDIRKFKYDGSAVVERDQGELDAIDAADIQAALDKQARIDSIRDKLINATPAQIAGFVRSNVTGITGAQDEFIRVYLLLRDLAIESNK